MCINTLSYEQRAINFYSFYLIDWFNGLIDVYDTLVGYDYSNWFSAFYSLKRTTWVIHSGIDLHKGAYVLIHQKEPIHTSHLFKNWTAPSPYVSKCEFRSSLPLRLISVQKTLREYLSNMF